jgi:hypothetical protein
MLIRMVVVSLSILIAAMMVPMFNRTTGGNGIQVGFRVVVMGHQVVTQES